MGRGNWYLVFLLAYAAILLWHLFSEFEVTSPWHIGALLAGVGLAGVAHWSRHGLWALAFLGGHMALEWYHHGGHWWHYSGFEFFLYGTHALFDVTFLWRELTAHARRWRGWISAATLLALLGVFAFAFTPPQEVLNFSPLAVPDHGHPAEPLKILLLSGLVGCVLAHIFLRHDRKKRA